MNPCTNDRGCIICLRNCKKPLYKYELRSTKYEFLYRTSYFVFRIFSTRYFAIRSG